MTKTAVADVLHRAWRRSLIRGAWCHKALARDEHGDEVPPISPRARSWSLVGMIRAECDFSTVDGVRVAHRAEELLDRACANISTSRPTAELYNDHYNDAVFARRALRFARKLARG